MAPLSFRGEPYVVDVVLRPLLSGARWLVGVGLGAALWWQDWIWWVPVPLVVSTLALEGWLALRSDRPIRVDLHDDRLVIDDRFAATMTVFADRVRAWTVVHQPRVDAGRPGHEVVMVLASERRVLAAIAAQLVDPLPPLPRGAVDVGAVDAWLGARAGLLRAMAPPTRICRQRIHDPNLVTALQGWVPEEARDHRALRLWPGAAPELSPFGVHVEEPGGILLLGPEGWQLTREEGDPRRGPRRCAAWSVAERQAVLFGLAGEPEAAESVLPLLVLHLPDDDGTTLAIAIPAPARGGADRDVLPAEVHHTHAPEGAVLLAWLLEAQALPEDLTPIPPAAAPHEPPRGEGDTPSDAPGDATR